MPNYVVGIQIETIVSIIIPIKNAAENIIDLLDSLEKQDYRPIETIFIDGGSTDGTIKAINEKMVNNNIKGYRIKLLKEEDFGKLKSPANARNIGIWNSLGEYLVFLDADMILTDNHLVSAVKNGLDKNEWVSVRKQIRIDNNFERSLAATYFIFGDHDVHKYCGLRRALFSDRVFDNSLGFAEDHDFFEEYLENDKRVKPVIVEANLQRHIPHSLGEYAKQQIWYGRTVMRYVLTRKTVSARLSPLLGSVLYPISLIATLLFLIISIFYHYTFINYVLLIACAFYLIMLLRVLYRLRYLPQYYRRKGIVVKVVALLSLVSPFYKFIGIFRLNMICARYHCRFDQKP